MLFCVNEINFRMRKFPLMYFFLLVKHIRIFDKGWGAGVFFRLAPCLFISGSLRFFSCCFGLAPHVFFFLIGSAPASAP